MKIYLFLKRGAKKPVVQIVLAFFALCFVIPKLNLDPKILAVIVDVLEIVATVLLKIK